MKLSKVNSVAFFGINTTSVHVEVDIFFDKSIKNSVVNIIGLPDIAVKESKDRVLTAIKNSNFQIPNSYITVNLAPGNLKKEGPMYDLPIAIGILKAVGIVKGDCEDFIILGEMSLSGQLREIRGALAMSIFAKEHCKNGVIVPKDNAQEAAIVDVNVFGASSLKDVVDFLNGENSITKTPRVSIFDKISDNKAPVDFAEICGQKHAKRALEIAAAGYHNILLCGPPGSGKSMLAKALVGILPPLSTEEAIEITKIHSLSKMLPKNESYIATRPFRAPHHTVSYAGLVGGGAIPRPGEISLAHHGILFMDELPEFSRATLEVLRQPLEDRFITISRAQGSFVFPTNILFVAAMNPCPCGFLGHKDKQCTDTPLQIQKYRKKISGPLLDRIDMHIEVPGIVYKDIIENEKYSEESSMTIRDRVIKCLEIQRRRFGGSKMNALMNKSEIKNYCQLNAKSKALMQNAMDIMGISARTHDKILRIARTIADLNDSERINENHLMEAIHFKNSGFSDEKISNHCTSASGIL